MKELEARWQQDAGKEFVERLASAGRSGNGHSVLESPFGATARGALDLRGLRLSERTELRRVSFAPSDFGRASFKGIWLQGCVFNDSAFDSASLQEIAEHHNTFENCNFLKASFRGAAIGYRGSRFVRCTFDAVDFRRAVFVRPEFDDCAFYHCRLDGCDLNAASFERCRFVGAINAVWFRGGFACPDDVASYGDPRPNKMTQVSFESAVLRDVTFSNRCDLSTLHAPQDGRHALVGSWPGRLSSLQQRCAAWPEDQRKAALAFATSHRVHAQTQDWFVLNRDDLHTEFGDETARRIWQAVTTDP